MLSITQSKAVVATTLAVIALHVGGCGSTHAEKQQQTQTSATSASALADAGTSQSTTAQSEPQGTTPNATPAPCSSPSGPNANSTTSVGDTNTPLGAASSGQLPLPNPNQLKYAFFEPLTRPPSTNVQGYAVVIAADQNYCVSGQHGEVLQGSYAITARYVAPEDAAPNQSFVNAPSAVIVDTFPFFTNGFGYRACYAQGDGNDASVNLPVGSGSMSVENVTPTEADVVIDAIFPATASTTQQKISYSLPARFCNITYSTLEAHPNSFPDSVPCHQ